MDRPSNKKIGQVNRLIAEGQTGEQIKAASPELAGAVDWIASRVVQQTKPSGSGCSSERRTRIPGLA